MINVNVIKRLIVESKNNTFISTLLNKNKRDNYKIKFITYPCYTVGAEYMGSNEQIAKVPIHHYKTKISNDYNDLVAERAILYKNELVIEIIDYTARLTKYNAKLLKSYAGNWLVIHFD